jgi:hypothetical protein
MWAMNILAANGREIVLGPGTPPRWQKTALGSKSTWFEGGTAVNKTAGIFRVWSTKFDEPGGLWRRDYPLTEAAKKARAAFNPLTDSVAPGCRPKGMPTIMEQPYPMEIVDRGDSIELLIEEYDTRRVVHVRGASVEPAAVAAARPGPLGYSVGRFEGTTLVVTTTKSSWGNFDSVGIQLSPEAVLEERFTPSADGARLDYVLKVTDATTFTGPVELRKTWIWRPEVTRGAYECKRVAG